MSATYEACRYVLLPGDLIQIDPLHDPFLGGCVLFVDDVTPDYVNCHVASPEGQIPYRVPYAKFCIVGPPCFIPTTLVEKRHKAWVEIQKAKRDGTITYLYEGSSTPIRDIEKLPEEPATIDSERT